MNSSLRIPAKLLALCAVIQTQAVAAAEPVVLTKWPGGYRAKIQSVCVSGGYAYCASGDKGLTVLGIQDRARTQFSGACELSGKTLAVRVKDSLAFVAADQGGMHVVDISTPEAPNPLASYTYCDAVKDVAVVGSRAYLADGTNGLRIIDVSNPAVPTLVGGYTQTNIFAEGVTISGTCAYLTAGRLGLLAIDISNETAPALLGCYDTPGYARAVVIEGSTAYVADGGAGILSLDVSSPANMKELSALPLPGYAQGIALSETNLIVAGGDEGVHVLQITTPGTAFLADTFQYQTDWISGIAVSEGVIYSAAGSRLDTLVVSNSMLNHLGGYIGRGRAVDVHEISGKRLVVADAAAGWHVLQAGSNSLSLLTATLEPALSVSALEDTVLFGEDTCGAVVWHLDASNTPTLIAEWNFDGLANKVVPAYGSFSCVAAGGAGLQIIDSGFATPIRTGTLTMGGIARSVAVSGTVACLAYGRVALVDIGDPYKPSRLAEIIPTNSVESVAVYKDYVVTAAGPGGVQIYDASDPSSPRLVSVWNQISGAVSVSVKGDFCLVAGGTNGMWILDISDPANPTLAGNCRVDGFVESVFLSGNKAYAAIGPEGVAMLQVFGFGQELPRIVVPPWSQTIAVGTGLSLAVEAQGAEPLGYQWHFNGSPLPGQTRQELHLAGSSALAGSYSVVVSNEFGVSEPAVVQIENLCSPALEGNGITRSPTNAVFNGKILGQPGVLYAIEAAESLSGPWQFMRYCASESGDTTFRDVTAPGARYFRARVVDLAYVANLNPPD